MIFWQGRWITPFSDSFWEEVERQVRTVSNRDERDARFHSLAALLKKSAERRVVPGWYLRMGELPESGRSTMHHPDYSEDGVSVFGGVMLEGGHYIVSTHRLADGMPNLRFGLWRLFCEEDRDAYFVRGRKIGRGGDREPLLGEIHEIEPVPKEAIIASYPSSRALEEWNERRGGPLVDRVPGLIASG